MLYYQKFHQAWTLTWAMRRWQVAVWYHFDAGWLTDSSSPSVWDESDESLWCDFYFNSLYSKKAGWGFLSNLPLMYGFYRCLPPSISCVRSKRAHVPDSCAEAF